MLVRRVTPGVWRSLFEECGGWRRLPGLADSSRVARPVEQGDGRPVHFTVFRLASRGQVTLSVSTATVALTVLAWL